ncbi:hypothetical protein RHMOL_Rhmol06G0084700 [Rhododendron molle]|uniref:Uncharacterized protein n=1 Tax=Rhododendron molle TaxID=49168 RepID=A0ACC0NA26_RHOML|nr:hypothetical protein RHMOL_Rhmol06G0084700 [Rhododendron molle]
MSTTQRSESINHFFDGYVHSNTTLKQFVEQYENAMGKRVQQEEDEDAHCFNAQIKTVSPYGLEDQFQQAYTIAKFKDFRDEVAGKISCQIERVMVVDDMEEFEIEEDIKIGEAGFLKTCTFHVRFNKQSKDTSCTCRLFEFKGIVCKHMFVVWSKKKLTQVSEKYILRRWRKDVRRNHTFVKVSYANWERKPEWHRFNKMLVLFHRVADKAFDSEGKSERVMAKLLEAEVENEVCDDDANRPMFPAVQKDSISLTAGRHRPWDGKRKAATWDSGDGCVGSALVSWERASWWCEHWLQRWNGGDGGVEPA